MNGYQVAFLLGVCAILLLACLIADMCLQGRYVPIKARFIEACGNGWIATKAAALGWLVVGGALTAMWGLYETLHALGRLT